MQEIRKEHKYFETQRTDEQVLIVARRHWTVYTPALAVTLLVYILAIAFFFSMESISFVAKNPALKASGIVFASLFLLFATLFIYINWLVNYLNVQIVTNMHVVDIDQFGMFSRKISELSLEEIQDISATKKGVMQSFLDYGDICVQTAGEKPNFNFEKVPEPHELARKIMEIKDQHAVSEHQRIEQGMGPLDGSNNVSQDEPVVAPTSEYSAQPLSYPEPQQEKHAQMASSESEATDYQLHENENPHDSQHQENKETNF